MKSRNNATAGTSSGRRAEDKRRPKKGLDTSRTAKLPEESNQLAASKGADLPTVITSDQFVAGIIATLALRGRRRFVLTETELDRRFQSAFDDLTAQEKELKVRPNFTFYVDPFHGDSVTLRETLLAAKEKELIALNNPTFRTFDVKLSTERAERYLERVPLSREFLDRVVERYFDR